MVLLDGLVERCLAQQQEAKANPHGQQPGHGEAESTEQHKVRTNRTLLEKSVHVFTTDSIFT